MFLPRSTRRSLSDSVPGLGTAAPLTPGLWSRPFMEPVTFTEGEASIDEDGLAQLDEICVALSWFSTSCLVEVAGHAWGEGPEDEQHTLAYQRAAAVRDALIHRGIPPWVIRVKGYGSARPVPAENRSRLEAADASRRVELWLHQRTADAELPCSEPGAEDCCRGC